MSERKLRQSVENLERALNRLGEALAEPLDNPLAIDGTIQRFEFALELTWKALKRLLEREGIEAATPRSTLKQAYAAGWIEDETAWLQMLRDRNATSHIYDEKTARRVYESIKANYPELTRMQAVILSKTGVGGD